jgi:hypothetical protein
MGRRSFALVELIDKAALIELRQIVEIKKLFRFVLPVHGRSFMGNFLT